MSKSDVRACRRYLEDKWGKPQDAWPMIVWLRIWGEALFWIISICVTIAIAEAVMNGVDVSRQAYIMFTAGLVLFAIFGLLPSHRLIFIMRSLITLVMISTVLLI